MPRGGSDALPLARTLSLIRQRLESEGVHVVNLEPGRMVGGVFTLSIQVAFPIRAAEARRRDGIAAEATTELAHGEWMAAVLQSTTASWRGDSLEDVQPQGSGSVRRAIARGKSDGCRDKSDSANGSSANPSEAGTFGSGREGVIVPIERAEGCLPLTQVVGDDDFEMRAATPEP